MVSFGTIAVLTAIGLAVFFRNDISQALGNLKGFGSSFGQDFGKLPDININVPEFPEIPIPDFTPQINQFGKDVNTNLGIIQENLDQFGIDTQKNINDAIKNAQDFVDQGIKDTQTNFNTGLAGIGVHFDNFGTGISDFFFPKPNTISTPEGGTLPPERPLNLSQVKPEITSRREGTSTRFGGQKSPKSILTERTATTPDQPKNIVVSIGGNPSGEKVVISETIKKDPQPDKTLVSPFLTDFISSNTRGTRTGRPRR